MRRHQRWRQSQTRGQLSGVRGTASIRKTYFDTRECIGTDRPMLPMPSPSHAFSLASFSSPLSFFHAAPYAQCFSALSLLPFGRQHIQQRVETKSAHIVLLSAKPTLQRKANRRPPPHPPRARPSRYRRTCTPTGVGKQSRRTTFRPISVRCLGQQ